MKRFSSVPTRHTKRRSNARQRRLGVERLEERALLAAFNYSDFTTAAGLSLSGDATITSENRLSLTYGQQSNISAAWYTAEKSLLAGGFETTFQFQVTKLDPQGDGSDGFAYVIQNSGPTERRHGGGHLAYDSMPNSVAVEFDTYSNGDLLDPARDHISIHTNGTQPNSVHESFSLGWLSR